MLAFTWFVILAWVSREFLTKCFLICIWTVEETCYAVLKLTYEEAPILVLRQETTAMFEIFLSDLLRTYFWVK